jgi:hypothetical protein
MRLVGRCFDAAMNVRENLTGDVLASLTTNEVLEVPRRFLWVAAGRLNGS